jgi:hypothetical protein
MARITPIPLDQIDPELVEQYGDSPLVRLFSHRPVWTRRYLDEHRPTMVEGTIERETKELVRLLIAEYTRCKT